MKYLFKLSFLLLMFAFCSEASGQAAAKALSLAEKYYKRQDYYSAFEYYDQALFSKSSSITNPQKRRGAMYKFAECARITYHFRKAEIAYKEVADGQDKDKYPKLDFYYAYTLKHNGKYGDAAKAFAMFAQKDAADDEMKKLKRHAEQEVISCVVAEELMEKADMRIKITGMDAINSKYSDFAPHEFGDELYFSSLKFERERRVRTSKHDVAENFLIGKLMSSKEKGKKQPVVLPLSEKYVNTGNSALSPDGKYIVFTKCVLVDLMNIRCNLFVAFYDEKTKKWGTPQELPKPINTDKFTTTHPSIGRDNARGTDVLFFVSDRDGGLGAFDIWECDILDMKGLRFGEIKNLGNVINSVEEEVTPHFNTQQQCLYFSSKWHHGLGGYDIFCSRREGDGWSEPENIGVPINSAANDMYFIINQNDTTGYFASNRPGSKILMGESCCNDIYHIQFPPPLPPTPIDTPKIDTPVVVVTNPPVDTNSNVVVVTKVDTPVVTKPEPQLVVTDRFGNELSNEIPITNINNTDETLDKLNKTLPIKLYFHNDEPDPRTRNTTTKQSYEDTYRRYIEMREEYVREHCSQFNDASKKKEGEDKINNFFDNYVQREFSRMTECLDLLLALLERGETLEIQLRGFTSARAKTDYNKYLAARRISSVRNELNIFRNGKILPYLRNGQLIITELPLGETEATSVGDDDNDPRNAVYGVTAAQDRRVEIVKIGERESK